MLLYGVHTAMGGNLTLTRVYWLITMGLGVYPLVWLAAFYTFIFNARIFLGFWPQFNSPDPKRLWFGLQVMHNVLYYAVTIWPPFAVASVFLSIYGLGSSKEHRFLFSLVTCVGSNLLLFLCGHIDPGGFLRWFRD
jgi:hypothetical protein